MYQVALAIDPDDPDFHKNIGLVLAKNREDERSAISISGGGAV